MKKGQWTLILIFIIGILLAILMKWGINSAQNNQKLQNSDQVILRRFLNEKTMIAVLGKDINHDQKKESIGVVLFKHDKAQIPGFFACKKFAMIDSETKKPILWIENGAIFNPKGKIDSIPVPFFWKSNDKMNEITFYKINSSFQPDSTPISFEWVNQLYVKNK